jgi:hypothetical protein
MATLKKEAHMGPDAKSGRTLAPLRRLSTILSTAVLAAAVASVGGTSCGPVKTSGDTGSVAKSEDFVAGQIVVWFDDDFGDAAVDEFVAKIGGEVLERSSVTPSRVVLAVPEGEEDRYVEAYRELEEVRAADKNYTFRTQPEGGGTGSSGGHKFKIDSE